MSVPVYSVRQVAVRRGWAGDRGKSGRVSELSPASLTLKGDGRDCLLPVQPDRAVIIGSVSSILAGQTDTRLRAGAFLPDCVVLPNYEFTLYQSKGYTDSRAILVCSSIQSGYRILGNYKYSEREKTAVLEELGRLLRHPDFAASRRMQVFIKYVVNAELEGNGSSLKGYTVAVDGMGRDPASDPDDPYIRNIATVTRKAITQYYSSLDVTPQLRIGIPKGSYQPVFDGIESLNNPAAPSTPAEAPGHSTSDIPLSSNCANDESLFKRGMLPTVAVLPFASLNTDAGKLLLGEIIADNAIALISQSNLIEVVSRLSTSRLDSSSVDLSTVRSKFNADYLLTGSFTVLGSKVRITAEFTDVNSGLVLWGDTLISSVEDICNQQGDASLHINSVLSMIVMKQELRNLNFSAVSSLESHTLLFCAINQMHRNSQAQFQQARQMLEQAIEKSGENACLCAYLSYWHILAVNRQQGWSASQQAQKNAAVKYADKALNLDAGGTLAHTVKGLTAVNFERNPSVAMNHYDTALTLNPNNSITRAYRGALHGFMENGDQALTDAYKAVRLSPLDPQLYMFEAGVAVAAIAAGRFELAEKHALASYHLNSSHTSNLRALIAIQVRLGKLLQARANAENLMKLDPEFTTSSYRQSAANSIYKIGSEIADSLEAAGVPKN